MSFFGILIIDGKGDDSVSFGFHILGLFVVYMLMCMYVVQSNEKKNSMFYKLLIINFVSQFLYLLSFIMLNVEGNLFSRVFLIKLFLASVLFWVVYLYGYIHVKMVRCCYIGKDSVFENRVRRESVGLFILGLVLVVIAFVLPISVQESKVLGSAVTYTFIVSSVFFLLSFLIMLIHFRKVKSREYLKLLLAVFVPFLVLMAQMISSKLGVLASGYTFVLLFLYLTLEGKDVQAIVSLKMLLESAEKENYSRTEFLEKLSREIRMPLNTIEGFSQVLLEEKDIQHMKEDAKDIQVASNNLVDLVNGLMDISLMEAGKMEISNYEYDTLEMLESVSMMAKSFIHKKDIEFEVRYSENIPRVLFGDSEKIKRILIHLFRNAVQYTDKGKIVFQVNAVNSSERCRLIMSVSDTGCGIAKEEMNSIFRRYESVVGQQERNGLGLAIVENLVGLMNGKIDVESVVQQGSTFTVTIDQKIVQAESMLVSSENLRVKAFDASGMRVMVVDDNKLNLKVAVRLLRAYQIEVVEAVSGREFLDIISQDHNFDLILMDDMMPQMSGTETFNIYKKIERVDGYSIPVVVLTANAISGMRDKYLKVGFDDYLAKPIDKYELHRVIKKYFKGKKPEVVVKRDKSFEKSRARGQRIRRRYF